MRWTVLTLDENRNGGRLRVCPGSLERLTHRTSYHPQQKREPEHDNYDHDTATTSQQLKNSTGDRSQPKNYDDAKQTQDHQTLFGSSRKAGASCFPAGREHHWRQHQGYRAHHCHKQETDHYQHSSEPANPLGPANPTAALRAFSLFAGHGVSALCAAKRVFHLSS